MVKNWGGLKRIVQGQIFVFGLILLAFPAFASAATVQGANVGTSTQGISSGPGYMTVCFNVPNTIVVRSLSIGIVNHSTGAQSLFRLYNKDTATTIWEVGSGDDKINTYYYTNYSTSTTSFTLTPAHYCINEGANSGNELFTGSATDGQIYSQPYNSSLVDLIANDPGTPFGSFGSVNYTLCDSAGDCPLDNTPAGDTRTRVVSFSPDEGETVSSPVAFSAHYYVNPDDLGGYTYLKITLHNIDQNVLLLSFLSPNDIILLDDVATTSGDIYFSTSTPIADGNYRISATIISSLSNPFGGTLAVGCLGVGVCDRGSHEFIVNEETFIGHISANSFQEFSAIFASSTATSSAALARSCNPLSWDTVSCLAFLFIPSSEQVNDSLKSLGAQISTRAPWGYITRATTILTATTTSTTTGAIPIVTIHIMPYWDNDEVVSIDTGDMIAGAGDLLDSTRDPVYNKNWKDVLSPFWNLFIALMTLIYIMTDMIHSISSHNKSNQTMKR